MNLDAIGFPRFNLEISTFFTVAAVLVPALEVDAFATYLIAIAILVAGASLPREPDPREVLLRVGLVVLAVSTRHLAGLALGAVGFAMLATPNSG